MQIGSSYDETLAGLACSAPRASPAAAKRARACPGALASLPGVVKLHECEGWGARRCFQINGAYAAVLQVHVGLLSSDAGKLLRECLAHAGGSAEQHAHEVPSWLTHCVPTLMNRSSTSRSLMSFGRLPTKMVAPAGPEPAHQQSCLVP